MPLQDPKVKERVSKQRGAASHSWNVSHETSQQREEQSRSRSQSSNREPLRPQQANPRVDAASLKLPVKNTIPERQPLKHQTSQSTLDEQENGNMQRLVKQEPMGPPPTLVGYQMYGQNNDDSTQLTMSSGDWEVPERGFSGEPTAILNPPQKPVSRNDPVQGVYLGSGWQQEADAGRRHSGRPPKYGDATNPADRFLPPPDDDDLSSDDDLGDDLAKEDIHSLREGTPSRAMNVPVLKSHGPPNIKSKGKKQVQIAPQSTRTTIVPREERSSSPLPGQDNPGTTNMAHQPQLQQSSVARHNDYRQHLTLVDPPQPTPEPTKQPKFLASKVSASHEASEEEQLPEQKALVGEVRNKRSHDDIDYNPQELRDKAYGDLDQVPFLTDPRAPNPSPATGMDGNPVPLTRKLTSLNQMKQEDQTALFLSLTDEENEEAGQWFVQQFQDGLKKLMERRLERRKIALKYESEAKKRETIVQAKMGDVGDELQQLRKGGGELIKDKSVAGVGGTPRKE